MSQLNRKEMPERGPNICKNLLFNKGLISNWQVKDGSEKSG